MFWSGFCISLVVQTGDAVFYTDFEEVKVTGNWLGFNLDMTIKFRYCRYFTVVLCFRGLKVTCKIDLNTNVNLCSWMVQTAFMIWSFNPWQLLEWCEISEVCLSPDFGCFCQHYLAFFRLVWRTTEWDALETGHRVILEATSQNLQNRSLFF